MVQVMEAQATELRIGADPRASKPVKDSSPLRAHGSRTARHPGHVGRNFDDFLFVQILHGQGLLPDTLTHLVV